MECCIFSDCANPNQIDIIICIQKILFITMEVPMFVSFLKMLRNISPFVLQLPNILCENEEIRHFEKVLVLYVKIAICQYYMSISRHFYFSFGIF